MDINKISNTKHFSAIAPEYQTAREIEAILNHPELLCRLGADETVTNIEKNSSGYSVYTSRGNVISVGVQYIPNGIGPQKFELIF